MAKEIKLTQESLDAYLEPHREDCIETPEPLYGKQKLQGEERMLEQADLAPLSAILDRVSPIDYKPYMPEDSVLHEFIG